MKNLYIVGARGFGRKVFCIAKESIGYGEDFVIAGFLDDKKEALDGYEGYPPIISSVENYEIKPNDVFICALGDVTYKKKYIDILRDKGADFITLIHKTACFEQNVKLGAGCIISSGVKICCDTTIGDFNTFQPYVVVGHDVMIGNYCHFNTFCFMGGFVKIDDMATIQTSAVILPHKRVSSFSVVGAGAVVLRNVNTGITVFGNPAVKLKQ